VVENFDLLGRGENAKQLTNNLENETRSGSPDANDKLARQGRMARELTFRTWSSAQRLRTKLRKGKSLADSDDENAELARAQLRRRQIASAKARFSWRLWQTNKGATRRPSLKAIQLLMKASSWEKLRTIRSVVTLSANDGIAPPDACASDANGGYANCSIAAVRPTMVQCDRW